MVYVSGRCNGTDCSRCWFASDPILFLNQLVDVKCSADEDHRRMCSDGEKGHFDRPAQEPKFIKKVV